MIRLANKYNILVDSYNKTSGETPLHHIESSESELNRQIEEIEAKEKETGKKLTNEDIEKALKFKKEQNKNY